jgi:anaerobic ribonucleoside-triphosphate reductase
MRKHVDVLCRTRVFENIHGPKTSVARGNLSFTTINIVGLALSVRHIKDKQERINAFMTKLDNMCDVVAKQLDERMQFQKTAIAKQFPLLMSSLWLGHEKLKPNDQVGDVIEQGTLAIGFIGLAECLVALIGKHHGESEEAQKLGIRIVTEMRDKCEEYKKQYNHNYGVIATPAEGLSGKFTKQDKKMHGIIPGVTDKDYYTNSNHVPVWYHCTIKHKAEVEAPYHDLTRGGHIFYVELDGDATHNPSTVKRVVDLMDKYNMGYGSVNHNRNRCKDCGHEDSVVGETTCPCCGSHNISHLARITGYLSGDVENQWNAGKQAEFRDRVTHD